MIKEKKLILEGGLALKEVKEFQEAQKRINDYRNQLLSNRVDWVNKRMNELVPKWQRWLMKVTKSKFVIDFFKWEVKCFNYPELGKHVIELQHKGKVIDSKTFKA